jgi:P27 family predicted phage terminase small subunit
MSAKPTHKPPAHLDGEARQKWAEVLPILQARGDVDAAALDAAAAYCQAYSRWTAAEAKVSELGPVVKSPAGVAVQSPYLAVAAAAQRQMRQWGDALRLTPKARGKGEAGESAILGLLTELDNEGGKSR